MKRIGIVVCLVCVLVCTFTYAYESKLLLMRSKIFEGSKDIKALLPVSKDAVLLTSMFDSCLIAVSQLDAYFSMLGIFEAIKKEDVTATSIDFIANWLNQIKRTNDMNINLLGSISQPIEAKTNEQAQRLKGHFTELNSWIDKEIVKFTILKKSIAPPVRPAGKKPTR